MDPHFQRFISPLNRVELENQSIPYTYSNLNHVNGPRFELSSPDQAHKFSNNFQEHSNILGGAHMLPNQPFLDNVTSSSYPVEDEYQEDCDFSDSILRYIDQMLMEEDMDAKAHMLQESLDLQAKEKSFYDVLGKKYPPSPEQNPFFLGQIQDDHSHGNYHTHSSIPSTSDDSGYIIDVVFPRRTNATSSSVGSSTSSSHGFLESPISPLQVRDLFNESQPVWNFKKGVEEASRFLPSGDKLSINFETNDLLNSELEKVKSEKKNEEEFSPSGSRGRKNPHREETDLEEEEERISKQPAICTESNLPIEEFDAILLYSMGDGKEKLEAYKKVLRNATSKAMHEDHVQAKGPNGKKGRGGKKNVRKKEVIDLRTLLISCAQAVAADDRKNAHELLKQIKLNSSPFGDGNQRLAHYFANGLEARLAGTGTQIHKALVNKRTTAADYLKAYHLYLASSPFRRISNFAANKTIKDKSLNSMRLHVIDFGILYGFQWPTLIQRISGREGGPPKLRITGIEFPQPGFKPAERIEETGRRLAHYAKTFNVPFEYTPIAQNWESIKIEDLKIDKDEFVVVNCLYRTKNLHDETVVADSSRASILKLIRKINPDIFIHGIVNGAYSAPFFVTRFREVLFHFSALFDMLETNVPREQPERMLIERDIFGREALNVIACEGWERIERPETYKQWQVRDMRAGFMQVGFEKDVVEKAVNKVRSTYHKDFVIYEDSQWLLLGWKGRIIFALSCWKPV